MARIIVAIDVEGASLEDSYARTYEFLQSAPDGMTWESTDESYEDDGTEVCPEDMQKARMNFFKKQGIV